MKFRVGQVVCCTGPWQNRLGTICEIITIPFGQFVKVRFPDLGDRIVSSFHLTLVVA